VKFAVLAFCLTMLRLSFLSLLQCQLGSCRFRAGFGTCEMIIHLECLYPLHNRSFDMAQFFCSMVRTAKSIYARKLQDQLIFRLEFFSLDADLLPVAFAE
jgi:hypothetical protein